LEQSQAGIQQRDAALHGLVDHANAAAARIRSLEAELASLRAQLTASAATGAGPRVSAAHAPSALDQAMLLLGAHSVQPRVAPPPTQASSLPPSPPQTQPPSPPPSPRPLPRWPAAPPAPLERCTPRTNPPGEYAGIRVGDAGGKGQPGPDSPPPARLSWRSMHQRSAVTPLEFKQPSPTPPLTDGRRGELAGDAPGLWRQALLNSGSALTPFPADAHLPVPGRSSKRRLDAVSGAPSGAPPQQHAPPPNDFGASPPAAVNSGSALTPFPADAHLPLPGRSSMHGLDAASGAPPTQHAPPPNDFGASPPALRSARTSPAASRPAEPANALVVASPAAPAQARMQTRAAARRLRGSAPHM
jgi:hypothetical protein